MAAVEVIYVAAASLWIVVVLAALGVVGYCIVKFRARRRRMNRLFGALRVPIQFGAQGVLLLRRCEDAGRTVALRIPMLLNELRSDRRAALRPGSSRR